MATVLDVPLLITELSTRIATNCGLKPSTNNIRKLSNAAHTVLLGLAEVEVLDVEEHQRTCLNKQMQLQVSSRLQKTRPGDCCHLQTLLTKLDRIREVPLPCRLPVSNGACGAHCTLSFTEIQSLSSLLLHLVGSAVRQQPCANDLFIPQHMPFDLASSQGRLGSQYALLQSNHSFEDLSNSTHALPQKAWSETQSRSESGAVARHPFSLLPAAAFEHLSDPTSLNACHGSIHSQPSNCASTDVPAQQAVGLTAWHTDENAIQSRLEAMQEKPVWEPVDPGMSQASDPPRAVGGMPYNLPLAMLQMDADPGSLTGFAKQPWSQGTNTDTKLPLAISSLQDLTAAASDAAALPDPSTALALHSAALPLPSTALAQLTERSVGQQAPGTDSLRSSDEFPANKENSHRQWPCSEGPVAPVKGAVGTEAADIVSEQVMAQQAVYALQGMPSSFQQLREGKLRTPAVQSASLASLLKPVVQSGERRQALEAFVAAFGVGASRSTGAPQDQADPVLQAFAAAVQSILRSQTSALNQLPAAVKQRRQGKHTGHGKSSDNARAETCHLLPMTVLEVVLHTQRLQAQLRTLSQICWSELTKDTVPETDQLQGPRQQDNHLLVRTQGSDSSATAQNKQSEFPKCRWTVEGFPKGPALLTHLHAELAQSDSQAMPVVQFLFVSAFQPYMHHIRSWMYSTAEVASAFAEVPGADNTSCPQLPGSRAGQLPQALPHFLQPYNQHFMRAGWQLRILSQMQPNCNLFVDQLCAIAATEAAEASLLLSSTPGLAEDGMPSWGFPDAAAPGGLSSVMQAQTFPLVFDSQALQQVEMVRIRACAERLHEADRLLTNLAEQRQMAEAAVTAEVLLRKQQLQDSREAVRAQKAEEGRQRRVYRAKLLREQQAAMTAQQARLEAERALQIRQEQEVLEAAAQQEHKAAVAAVAAATKSAKQDLQQMQDAAQRMAWRTQRWRVAQLRRAALEEAEAAEDAELQILLSDPTLRQTPPGSAPPERDALSNIQGFQAFQAPIPTSFTPSATIPADSQPQPEPVSTGRTSSTDGTQAAAGIPDSSGRPDMVHAVESSAVSGDATAPVEAATRARGRWGTPQQPFVAAGRSTPHQLSAAQLMSHDDANTAAPAGSVGDLEVTTAVVDPEAQAAAQLAESLQPESATAELEATTSTTSSHLPQSSETSIMPTDDQPSATCALAERSEGQSPQRQSDRHQQPVAIAVVDRGAAVKPAAGAYRRVAWAPVQNPFLAAGARAAAAAAPLASCSTHGASHAADSSSGHVARQEAFEQASKSVNGSSLEPESCGSEQAGAAQGVPELQESEATASADMLSGADVEQEHIYQSHSQPKGRQRRSWKAVTQPFAAAGVGSSHTAAAPAGAEEISRSAAAASLPMPRNRRRWEVHHPTAAPASQGNHGPLELKAAGLGPGQEEEGLVPLSVVMDACLVQGITEQYRCVSKACLWLFIDELKVMSLFRTFQRYFFMAAGDWAETLNEALCAHTAQHGMLHEHSLQNMLDSSFKGTSVELDPNAANVRASLKLPVSHIGVVNKASLAAGASASLGRTSLASPGASASKADGSKQSNSHSASAVIHNNQLNALEAVQLSYDVQWPLNLVVTQDAVKQYDAVFSWLLCLKRVALLMRNLWLGFASFQASAQRSRHKHVKSSEATGTSMEDVFDQRLRILQLFRHEAAHLTTALQAYVHGQLLGDCWGQLQIHIKSGVTDLSELQHAHMQYLAQAQRHCLMSEDTREVRAIIEPVLQCVVDFIDSFRSSCSTPNDVQSLLKQDNARWSLLHKHIQDFQLRASVLYKVLKYANGRGHYQELFVQLNVNQYYAT